VNEYSSKFVSRLQANLADLEADQGGRDNEQVEIYQRGNFSAAVWFPALAG